MSGKKKTECTPQGQAEVIIRANEPLKYRTEDSQLQISRVEKDLEWYKREAEQKSTSSYNRFLKVPTELCMSQNTEYKICKNPLLCKAQLRYCLVLTIQK